jgi:hypothetical protein
MMALGLRTRPLGTPRALLAHLPIAGDPRTRPTQTAVAGTPLALAALLQHEQVQQEQAPFASLYRASAGASPASPAAAQVPLLRIVAIAAFAAAAAMLGATLANVLAPEEPDLEPIPIPITEVTPERPVAAPPPAPPQAPPEPTTSASPPSPFVIPSTLPPLMDPFSTRR